MTITYDIELLIEDILEDRTHGASQLARQALEVMKTAAERNRERYVEHFRANMEEIAWRLMSIRPSMAPIYNAIKRLLALIDDNATTDVDTLRQHIITQAEELIQSSISALAQIGSYTADLLSNVNSVMIHSYSSTVMMAVKMAHKRNPLQVTLTRAGVGRPGQRSAWELNYEGIQVTFIDDTAVSLYVSQVQAVLVGADRICADGGVVNGVGTFMVALTAQRLGVPVYVLCETLKFDPRLKSTEVELEEKDPTEVVQPGILPEGIDIKNPYFDITPSDLVSGIITEDGMVKPQDLSHYFMKLTAQLR